MKRRAALKAASEISKKLRRTNEDDHDEKKKDHNVEPNAEAPIVPDLPEEIWVDVAKKLLPRDVVSLSHVCRTPRKATLHLMHRIVNMLQEEASVLYQHSSPPLAVVYYHLNCTINIVPRTKPHNTGCLCTLTSSGNILEVSSHQVFERSWQGEAGTVHRQISAQFIRAAAIPGQREDRYYLSWPVKRAIRYERVHGTHHINEGDQPVNQALISVHDRLTLPIFQQGVVGVDDKITFHSINSPGAEEINLQYLTYYRDETAPRGGRQYAYAAMDWKRGRMLMPTDYGCVFVSHIYTGDTLFTLSLESHSKPTISCVAIQPYNGDLLVATEGELHVWNCEGTKLGVLRLDFMEEPRIVLSMTFDRAGEHMALLGNSLYIRVYPYLDKLGMAKRRAEKIKARRQAKKEARHAKQLKKQQAK